MTRGADAPGSGTLTEVGPDAPNNSELDIPSAACGGSGASNFGAAAGAAPQDMPADEANGSKPTGFAGVGGATAAASGFASGAFGNSKTPRGGSGGAAAVGAAGKLKAPGRGATWGAGCAWGNVKALSVGTADGGATLGGNSDAAGAAGAAIPAGGSAAPEPKGKSNFGAGAGATSGAGAPDPASSEVKEATLEVSGAIIPGALAPESGWGII